MATIVFPNYKNFKEKKKALQKDAKSGTIKLVTDFDSTLTHRNSPASSFYALLSTHLSPEYAHAAKQLYEKYGYVEEDFSITFEEKYKLMQQWWEQSFELLKAHNLHQDHIETLADHPDASLRKGTENLLSFLHEKDVPTVIFSATGLGNRPILLLLAKLKVDMSKVFCVANHLEWKEDGTFSHPKTPLIHSANKYESVLMEHDFYTNFSDKKGAVLMGDSLDDAAMVDDTEENTVLRIAFFNHEVSEKIQYYKKRFDVILCEDQSMDFVQETCEDIFS